MFVSRLIRKSAWFILKEIINRELTSCSHFLILALYVLVIAVLTCIMELIVRLFNFIVLPALLRFLLASAAHLYSTTKIRISYLITVLLRV